MWNDLPRPAVIAHRGDKQNAPENTLAAFTLAADKGADAIEFDVKLCADGQIVILHDQTVNRTTNWTGKISQIRFAELRELDAGKWFSETFRNERIPTLEEVFEVVGKRVLMNIELTNYATPGDDLVRQVVELVKKYGMEERVLFSSFLVKNLKKAQQYLTEVPRGLLIFPGLFGSWARTLGWRGSYYAIHPNIKETTSGLVNRIHANRKRVYVWTVNSDDEIKKMIGLGVDALFTDNPELALRIEGRIR